MRAAAADVAGALLAALRFRAFPEAPAVLRALRARGARLVVVSNWDVSLHDVLERTGLRAARRRRRHLGRARRRQARPGDLPRARWRCSGAARATRCMSATASSTTSPVRAPRASGRCSSPATARGARRRARRRLARRAARADTARRVLFIEHACPPSPTPFPPPSSLAPELPGVSSARRRRRAALWRPWTASAGVGGRASAARSWARSSSASSAPRRRDLNDPPAGGEHLGDVRPGPVASSAPRSSSRGCRAAAPEDFGLRPTRCAGAGLDGRCARRLLPLHARLGRDPRRQPRRRRSCPSSSAWTRARVALLAVAVLVAVMAPIAEELFFRGYFFAALRNWTGPVAGGDHHRPRVRRDPRRLVRGRLPAPAGLLRLRAVPALRAHRLAVPCIALHCINNSLAFGVSQHWAWEIPVLMVRARRSLGAARAGGARWSPAPALRLRLIRHGQSRRTCLQRYIAAP